MAGENVSTDYSFRVTILSEVQFDDTGDGEDPLLNALKKLVVILETQAVNSACASISVVLSLDASTDCFDDDDDDDDNTAAVDPVVSAQTAAMAAVDVTFMFGLQ